MDADKDVGDDLDVYDWLETADIVNWRRCCPKCKSDDVKYAVHSGPIKEKLSVMCNSCRHYDSGLNSGADAERLVTEWHEDA